MSQKESRYGLEGNSLLIEVSEGVAVMTLNRAEQHNALSRELRNNLHKALRGLNADDAVSAIIVTGAGKAFSAGADLHELETDPLHPDEMGADCAVMQAFAELDKPIIAAINGVAITGGFELVANCDILVASTRARFADTHARVGVVSAWGLTQTLPMLIGPVRANYMSLTGNFVDARTAKDWGLVLDVLEPEQLLPYCRQLAQDMLGCEPRTLSEIRRCIRTGLYSGLEQGLAQEAIYAKDSVVRFDVAAFALRRNTVMKRGRSQLVG